jgi:hypothetical protein
MAVQVKTEKAFTSGKAVELFKGPYSAALAGRPYDATADGQKFVMIKIPETRTPNIGLNRIVVVQNWQEELAQRAMQ